MESTVGLINRRLVEQMILAGVFAGLYQVAWWIQVHFLGVFDIFPGVSLLFLPAGIKLLAIIIGGFPGVIGVYAVAVLADMQVWAQHDLMFHLASQMVWIGAPYLTYLAIRRYFQIDDHLVTVTGGQIGLVAVVVTVASSLASRAFYYVTGDVPLDIFNVSTWGMSLGDVAGIMLVLFGVSLVKRRIESKHSPSIRSHLER